MTTDVEVVRSAVIGPADMGLGLSNNHYFGASLVCPPDNGIVAHLLPASVLLERGSISLGPALSVTFGVSVFAKPVQIRLMA